MSAIPAFTDSGHALTEVLDGPPAEQAQPVLRLRLKKAKNDRKVGWCEGTVDNEHMNKKKSKCCCIYKKPVAFGDSSSEDDEECEHCFGHPEKRRRNYKHDHDNANDHDDSDSDAGPSCCRHGDRGGAATETRRPESEPAPQPSPEPMAVGD